MAKFFLAALALFVVVNSINCDSSEEILDKVKSKHIRKVLTHNKEHLDDGLDKLEKHCPGVTEKLKDAVKQVEACNGPNDETLTLCQELHLYALNCTQPLIKVVDDCLPEKAKGLPILAAKSLLSLSDFLCKQTGESIFELANPCLWEDSESEDEMSKLDECEHKIKDFAGKHKDGDHLPTPTEVCTSVTDLRSCIQTRGSLICKNQKTKDIFTGVFDALVAPCSHINQA